MTDVGIGAERLAALLGNKFGHPCRVHHVLKDNPCSYFCLDCRGLQQEALCLHCRADHPSHCILQVRKASLYEVVRTQDLEGLVDTEGIQQYFINGAKVTHLNKRPMDGRSLLRRHIYRFACLVCKRKLMDGGPRFCSVGCKIEHEAQTPLSPLGCLEESTNHHPKHDGHLAATKIKKNRTRLPRGSLNIQDATTSRCASEEKEATPRRRLRKGRPLRSPFY